MNPYIPLMMFQGASQFLSESNRGPIGGSGATGLFAQGINTRAEDIKLQKEFAQNGIKWRVEDAKRAGIHPLAALGAAGASYSPVGIGDSGYSGSSGAGESQALSDMGQNFGRALEATSTKDEKQFKRLQLAAAQADLEGKLIDNQLRAAQLSQLGKSPDFPGTVNMMPGQGDSPGVLPQPYKRESVAPDSPSQTRSWRPSVDHARTETGLIPVITQDLSEPMEDDFMGHLVWNWNNRVMPNLGGVAGKPAKSKLPRGYDDWEWSYKFQEWQPVKGGTWYDRVMKKSRWPY